MLARLPLVALIALTAMPLCAQQAAPVPAPSPTSPAKSDITVVGRRTMLSRQLQGIVQESGQAQIARFESKVCPGVSGAPKGTADTLVRLIRTNALNAGMRLDPEGCKPNALLIFVTKPADLVAGMRKRSPDFFDLVPDDVLKRVTEGNDPIRSWHVNQTAGRDGEYLAPLGGVNGESTDRRAVVVRNAGASRVYENIRQDMKLSFAIVESGQAVGKSVQQLADIATLHLFLDIRPDAAKSAGSDSILSLFANGSSGSTAPPGLTTFDRGMLSGLYRQLRNNFTADTQRGTIARAIRKGDARDDSRP